MVRACVFGARCGRATGEEKAQAILAVGSFDSPGTGMDGGDETIVICPQIEGHFFLCFGGAEFFPWRNVFRPSFSAITQEIDFTMESVFPQ